MTEISSGSTPPGAQVPMFSRLWRFVTEPQLAVRVFFVLSALLVVAITATSATLLYNSANTLRDEAEANAVRLAELLADSYAEMGEISLANVARTLDATLDSQMTAQARIAAEMVAAAEAAAYEPARINVMLDGITRDTVIDEFWITDEVGFSYLTNVKDDAGVRVPFRFDPDPAVQPQASKFFVLLAAPPDDDGFIVQPAVVREIDNDIVKYVGVGGIDKSRIVQIGNIFNFGDQEILSNLAASERGDVSDVIEGILGQQMTGQAELARRFVAAAEDAGWSAAEIEDRLRRIVATTVIGEIRVADADGDVVYSSLPDTMPPDGAGKMPYFQQFATLLDGPDLLHEHPSEPRPSDGLVYKYVAAADRERQRVVQVGILIESSYGNLLYSVYQREADVLVRSQNIDTIWVVNPDRDLAAAAPRLALQSGDEESNTVERFESSAAAMVQTAMDEARVTSRASLSLFSPDMRGIVVAAPIINTGGIAIGALAIEVGLDGIAGTVINEAVNTTIIAFLLLGLTGGGALWGSRRLTSPIEVIAEAAKQVESGTQPDARDMEDVLRRGDEIGRSGPRLLRHDRAGLQPRGTARDACFRTDARTAGEQPAVAPGVRGDGAGPRNGQGRAGRARTAGQHRRRQPHRTRPDDAGGDGGRRSDRDARAAGRQAVRRARRRIRQGGRRGAVHGGVQRRYQGGIRRSDRDRRDCSRHQQPALRRESNGAVRHLPARHFRP